MRPVESQVGPLDPSGMIRMASCRDGIPGDSGDSLYRSSSLRRRRDVSPVRGTVESVGQEGVGVNNSIKLFKNIQYH